MIYNETIAAIATAIGNSGIGIIRISGNDSIMIANKIFKSVNNKTSLLNVSSHTIHYGFIYDEDEMIDEVLVSIMKSPNSFTTEDVVEINCHGGSFVMKKILSIVLKNGARCAEPGEFTKRAFMNGRIDLSKAEAVIDVIQAKNDFALRNSISQLRGTITEKVVSLRKMIIQEIAFIESSLDDPEHISLDGYSIELSLKISDMVAQIEALLKNADNGRIQKEGIKTVILGKPNAGKSSLLNRLLGKDRAIVSEIAGTTRDTIEESVYFDGITLNLIDTAGIHETEDQIEKLGVDRSIQYIDQADLIIFVIDSSTLIDENDMNIMGLIKDKPAIIIRNKTDLDSFTDESDIISILDKPVISLSLKNDPDFHLLENEIKDLFYNNLLINDDEVYITNIRQKSLIENAKKSILLVKKSIDDHMPEDFFSIDLMNAYEYLGQVIGENIGDDLANQIFSKFCMGK